MRLISVLILSIIISSCSKSEDFIMVDTGETPPQISWKKDPVSINDFFGSTYNVNYWNFEDHVTKEQYDLLEVNSESDSIYLHFTDSALVIVQVESEENSSNYKWKYYPYIFDNDNKVQIKVDEYLSYDVTETSRTNISFEGTHDLHQQFQTNDVVFSKMSRHPAIVQELLDLP